MSAHEVISICCVYVVFEGHVCDWHMYAYNMIEKLLFIVLFNLYVH